MPTFDPVERQELVSTHTTSEEHTRFPGTTPAASLRRQTPQPPTEPTRFQKKSDIQEWVSLLGFSEYILTPASGAVDQE